MHDSELLNERLRPVAERISQIPGETLVPEAYREYFSHCAEFLKQVLPICEEKVPGEGLSLEQLKERNHSLYADILPEQYETSYANPAYAVAKFGGKMGQYLSMLYTELRHCIAFAYEKRYWDLTVLCELFSEVYSCFTDGEVPTAGEVRDILYWFFSDYSEEMVSDRIREQVDPSLTFATDIVMKADLTDLSYLYRYGEYITENELGVAAYMNQLSEAEIEAMAHTYTEGYRIGFVHAGIDLSKKKTVEIRYPIGFERMVRAAVGQFAAMGLKPTMFRYAQHAISRRQVARIGYVATPANPQFIYDHRTDDALFLDDDFVSRKLRVTQMAYEKVKEAAAVYAGPACIDTFGEATFVPVSKPESLTYTPHQQKLLTRMQNELSQITNRYIRGDQRSFTIIAYPVPEIGKDFEKIFAETVRVNTLDYKMYETIQQTIIDTLDKGDRVHVIGQNGNHTDLYVNLWELKNPAKETIFENCVADVNIPVGEVFTSPVLKGTNGVLHVTGVYLESLYYKDLSLTFTDGKITAYDCANFADPAENQKYIFENLLFNHKTLPIGEFAIGTNTTAYVMARQYGIEAKMPILIAEKTGPHFAVGDTCYSWAEDVPVYNPDGKEIVARDNEVSLNRKEDPSKAYMNCHTDITIPYDELALLCVEDKDGNTTDIIRNGRFVLPGTEELNRPLDEAGY